METQAKPAPLCHLPQLSKDHGEQSASPGSLPASVARPPSRAFYGGSHSPVWQAASGQNSKRGPLAGAARGTAPCERTNEQLFLPKAARDREGNGDIVPHQDILCAWHLLLCSLRLKALKFHIQKYNERSSRLNSHSDLSRSPASFIPIFRTNSEGS